MINLEFNSKDISTDSKLSAIFTADNFIYACFDQDNNIFSYRSGHKSEDLDDIVSKFNPDNVRIAVKTTHFGHFGDKARIPFDKHKLTLDKLTGVDIWAAYERPFVGEQYETRHFSTLFQYEYYLNNDKIFHIHFDEDQMHFFLQVDGEILLYNHYPFHEVDDLLYYHTFITQSFDLKTEFIPLHLTGLIESDSKVHKAIEPFHKNLVFYNGSNCKLISSRQDIHPCHFYDHIMNIQCV